MPCVSQLSDSSRAKLTSESMHRKAAVWGNAHFKRVHLAAAKLRMCWEVCSNDITLWVAERVCWCLSGKALRCQLRCSKHQSTDQWDKSLHLKVNVHTFSYLAYAAHLISALMLSSLSALKCLCSSSAAFGNVVLDPMQHRLTAQGGLTLSTTWRRP